MQETVVLVEGLSDKFALETLAARLDRDLESAHVTIVAMGGVTNIGRHLDMFGPGGTAARLAGLCDAGEEHVFRESLERAGLGTRLDRNAMAAIGFFVCDPDLEAELIASLGPEVVERIIEEQGELRPWEIFQRQPAQRNRRVEAQLHRFLGTRAGRKITYGSLLMNHIDLDRIPKPLAGVLDHIQ